MTKDVILVAVQPNSYLHQNLRGSVHFFWKPINNPLEIKCHEHLIELINQQNALENDLQNQIEDLEENQALENQDQDFQGDEYIDNGRQNIRPRDLQVDQSDEELVECGYNDPIQIAFQLTPLHHQATKSF